MNLSLKRVLLTAAACTAMAGTPVMADTISGRAESARSVAFDVVLPLHDTAGLETLLTKLHDPASPLFHQWLTPAEFGRRFGPSTAVVDRVVAALRTRGFAVTPHTRSVHAVGPADLTEATFGTHLMVASDNAGHAHILNDGSLHLPDELTAAGAAIYSFSPHVAHVLSHPSGPMSEAGVDNRASAVGPYWFDDLKQAYTYPSVLATVTSNGVTRPLDGTGATIGVLMASDVYDSDIKAMFNHEKWSGVSGAADPKLYKHIAINGGGGLGGNALAEASLDTQQALGGAPGAHVVLYNIPSLSDGDVFAGYSQIVEDNLVDAVSSSFGGCELAYFPKYNNGKDYRSVLRTQHELFQQGNAQGISFLASSGDEAGLECPTLPYFEGGNGHFIKSVSEPADDPNVTAVGGTNLVTAVTAGSLDSSYVSENAWSDPEQPYDPYNNGGVASGGVFGAGGGYSALWAQPEYQANLATGSTKWRAMPDIGMQVGGCPFISLRPNGVCDGGDTAKNGNGNTQRSAVEVAIAVGMPHGGFEPLIGTSVASPEFLSAVALLVEAHGARLGNLNDYIYSLAKGQASGGPQFYHTGIPGYNGVKNTLISPVFSLSTGVGTPIVNSFLFETSQSAAGVPQTPSNP